MSIDPLTDGAALLQTAAEQRSGGPRDDTRAAAVAPGDQVLITGAVSRNYEEIQLQKERQNGVAGGIRETDRSLRLLGQKIDSLKAPLETIVKNYPPFSDEDKERMKLLMSYSAIRREIESLTIPPPPDLVKSRHTLELPEPLPATAKDSQINDHLTKLDAATASLTAMRRALAAETTSIAMRRGFTVAEMPLSGASMSEEDAREKSAEVGRQIAVSVTQGAAVQTSQFLKY